MFVKILKVGRLVAWLMVSAGWGSWAAAQPIIKPLPSGEDSAAASSGGTADTLSVPSGAQQPSLQISGSSKEESAASENRPSDSSAAPSVSGFSSRPKVVLVDRILVVVNNDVITENELAIRLDYVVKQLRAQNISLPPQEVLEKQLLERMIVEKLQVQRGRDMDLQVTDEHLAQIIKRIIDTQRPGSTEEEFKAALESDGINYEYFREDLRKEMLISMVRQNEIDAKVQVTNDEIDNYLINQNADNTLELDLSHIVIRIPEDADESTIREKMTIVEQVMNELNQGADFRQVAMRYSDAQDGLRGGEIGWRLSEGLPPFYVDAVANLADGQLAGPLRSIDGVHIVRLNGRRQAGETAQQVEQYAVRHILLKPDEGNSLDVVRDRLLQIRDMLIRDPSRFEELARQYSQDTTANNGGSLGWITMDDVVPEFGRMMSTLPINEISEPLETPFGWHLIQVTDKRTVDVSETNKRTMAKKALQERKAEEMYQQWLREQRDQAFIEFKEYENE